MSDTLKADGSVLTRQEQRTAKTRQALLDAALLVLEEVGYNEATVGLIAKTARRAHGTFYVHFVNKEEIYSELLKEMRERLHQGSRAVWDSNRPVESIRRSIDLYVRSFEDDRTLWVLLDGSSATSALFREARRSLRDSLVTDIRKGIASTAAHVNLGNMDVALVCEILAAMLEETCVTSLLYGEGTAREKITDHVSRMWGRILGYDMRS
ncbi:TetR/AcrR family transcriptional regulator [Nocardioides sp. CN2-186]|uniref:TetR/AcrR family transcriptional regulator n=1 Tax=Nocardioides tweenelious TaxID=3156607 RepID=UPI0032B49705